MFKRQIKGGMSRGIQSLRGLGILQQHRMDHGALGTIFEGNDQGHVSVRIRAGDGLREASQQRLDDHLIHDLAAPEDKVQGQVPVFVRTLGAGEVLRQEGGDDPDGGIVAACNVQGQAASLSPGGPVYHRVGPLGRALQQKFEGVDRVKFGSDVDGETAADVHFFDPLLEGTVQNFQGAEAVVGRGVMDGEGAHAIAVEEGRGEELDGGFNEGGPGTGLAGDDVEGKFAADGVDGLREFGIVVEHFFDRGPMLFTNVMIQFLLHTIDSDGRGQ
mmetsp:Transcript_39125/g.91138  ORF Transcript_39125/g.91138 Transcript_39125/m.91138 type:complete len:273 (+) Transcript_39125:1859-2677(+)